MIISTNLSAIFTHEQLSRTDDSVTKSMEKLSSGYKINSSADDSVGMALSETMRLQLRGLERGKQNTSDGISVVETAEGALQEINEIITRLRQLAVQGSNGIYTEEDRVSIQSEVKELKDEINRISRDTEFNGVKILNGELKRDCFCYKTTSGAANLCSDFDLIFSSAEVKTGRYAFTYDVTTDATGKTVIDQSSVACTGDFSRVVDLKVTTFENYITFEGANNFYMEVTIDEDLESLGGIQSGELEITDMGGMIVQMGAKEGQTLCINIPEVSAKSLGILNLDMSDEKSCESSISLMDKALERIIKIRGELGAIQNRFEHSIASLSVTIEATNESISRTLDTDMAEEMTKYTSLTVVQQAGIAMLTQANQQPEKVLQLLQY